MDNGDGVVTTSMRLRVWWLKMFKGYRTESVHRIPKENVFGEIYYLNRWYLTKSPKSETAQEKK